MQPDEPCSIGRRAAEDTGGSVQPDEPCSIGRRAAEDTGEHAAGQAAEDEIKTQN